LKNVPVLFFFTGQHSDYHKPTDDIEAVNYEGISLVAGFVSRVVNAANSEPKFTFTPTATKTNDTPGFKVTLGIMPDYVYDGEGVRVDGVTDGRPAAKAGLKTGDVIVKLGEYEVKTMQDYMKALSKFTKGQSTTVKVKRGTETVESPVTF
jgi:S1-C subfamily serine protease